MVVDFMKMAVYLMEFVEVHSQNLVTVPSPVTQNNYSTSFASDKYVEHENFPVTYRLKKIIKLSHFLSTNR